MAKKSKKVINTNDSKAGVINIKSPSGKSVKLSFDFSYPHWLSGIQNKGFTNKLKDSSEFAESIIHIMYKLIPSITNSWDLIKDRPGQIFKHCHAVSDDKIELVKQIEIQIHGKSLLDPEAEQSIKYWQIGIEGIRVFVLYNHSANIMFPIFIDYHHLVYPSIKHNQRDFDSLGFCPVFEYC
ncbi:hypothetical protein BSK66_22225 [Paenibacillus odorifer]|uniref:Uncharacterized protein n=1 Tax=Paenibacillus odorifer TaxID=189426 RepID=A0A1R0X0H5_9BACL|nr:MULTISPECIES: hypothetical protein [Paenibacillus]ETT55821.1 hypothetical protein C171_19297 [Paenibacillus sp. FSL H8-237]OMD25495.1 hypothetical protein BJP51_04405 [Paenibacillus odorifer]OME51954.1 hypothetical protein BSK66_22225 [Paenibacillus odorifer]